MNKLKMHSLNKVDENIKKIGALFPNCVTERKNADGEIEYAIDFDMLKQELSDIVVEGKEERYQFTWPDKKKSILAANAPISDTLRPCREESVDFDNTQNLYIEGDNLAVLKLLQETYLGKIKMIYIDPPYNTGNDFVYNDDFAESAEEYLAHSGQFDEEGNRLVANTESNGRFHTDWLNMVYTRIKLAKDLLSEDGFIFLSIDDNEVNNLKKICDEIFGEKNFRSMITVMANPGGRDYGGIAKTTEYLLVYSKTEQAEINKVADENHVFEMKDSIGPFELRELRNRNTVFNDKNRPNLCYPFYLDPSDVDEHGLYHIALEPDERHTVKVMPLVSQGIQTVWRWGKEERSRKNLNINIKGKLKQDGTYMIVEKYRDEKVMVKNTWLDKKFRTENGSVQIRELFGDKGTFSYPKPAEIPRLICSLCTDEESYILDFFSGSATTAHAVMQLNAEDGGNRKFIMVQLPEKTDEKSEAYKAGYKTICEIGKERIRRAGAKIKADRTIKIDVDKSRLMQRTLLDDGSFDDKYALKVTPANDDEILDNLDIGFRVLKLDSSNMNDVYYAPDEYTGDLLSVLTDNIKADRTPEDLLFQVMLDLGVLLSSKIEEEIIGGKKVFNVADGFLYACFDSNVSEETITAIAKKKPYYFVMRDSSMANDSVATNFDQIFATYSPDTERKVL